MGDARAQAGPVPPGVLDELARLQLACRRLVRQNMAGQYVSAFRGRGMQFDQVRAYAPGDDVRHIDWNVTARHQTPFVKEFRAERELTVVLVVDVSRSMHYGHAGRSKLAVAAELAGALAHLAAAQRDRVGLVIFGGPEVHALPPRAGRAHVWRLLREVLAAPPAGAAPAGAAPAPSRLADGLEALARLAPRHTVGFLISDFLDPQLERGLSRAAARAELCALQVVDPTEGALPPVGLLRLADPEGQEAIWFDAGDAGARRALAEAWAAHLARVAEAFARRRIDRVQLSTRGSWTARLLDFFRQRGARHRRAG